jgi:hypothetical protein
MLGFACSTLSHGNLRRERWHFYSVHRMDFLFPERNNGRIQHSHPDLQAGTLLRASQPIFFRRARLVTGMTRRWPAQGVASSGREACAKT